MAIVLPDITINALYCGLIVILIILLICAWHKFTKPKRYFKELERLEQILYENPDKTSETQKTAILSRYEYMIDNDEYGITPPEIVVQKAEDALTAMVNTNVGAVTNWHDFELMLDDARVRTAKANALKAISNKDAKTKIKKIENYNNISQTNHLDTQNVHDSAVNSNLRDTYDIILGDVNNILKFESTEFIHDYIDDMKDFDATKKKNAKKTLDRMMSSNSKISAANNDTENTVLYNVWNRANHSENIKNGNSTNIKNAIVEALADCVEDDNVVCSGGRSARIIASLATIDIDQTMGKVVTKQAYRNEVFKLATESLNREVQKDLKSSDSDVSKYANTFITEDWNEMDDSGIAMVIKDSFAARVMVPIDNYINANKKHLSDNIRDEVTLGLGLLD